MAKAPDAYHDTLWYADPETGQLIEYRNGEETGTTGSLEDISGGTYRGEPFRFRENSTGYIRWNMQSNFPSWVRVSPTGDMIWYREAGVHEINQSGTSVARFGVEGTFSVQLPDGTIAERTVMSQLTRPNDRIIVKAGTEPGDMDRYRYVREMTPEGQPLPSEPPSGWEWADQLTVLNRGLIGRIMRDEQELLRDMVAMHMRDENGIEMKETYQAAAYLARMTEAHPTLANVVMT